MLWSGTSSKCSPGAPAQPPPLPVAACQPPGRTVRSPVLSFCADPQRRALPRARQPPLGSWPRPPRPLVLFSKSWPLCPAPPAHGGEEALFVLLRDAATRSPRSAWPQHPAASRAAFSFFSFFCYCFSFFFFFSLSEQATAGSFKHSPEDYSPTCLQHVCNAETPVAPSQPPAPAFSWLSFWVVGTKSGHADSHSIHFHTFDSTFPLAARGWIPEAVQT